MKRRDFLLGSIWGGVWGSIVTLLIGKKEEKPKDLKTRWILGGQRVGKSMNPEKYNNCRCDFAKKPKLVTFCGSDGTDILGVTYEFDDELAWGTWECSDSPNFDNYAALSPRNCFDLSNYRGPRYIRVHVFGVYADDIIDTSREKEPRKQQS